LKVACVLDLAVSDELNDVPPSIRPNITQNRYWLYAD